MLARCGICNLANRRNAFVACDWKVLKKGVIVCLPCAYRWSIPISFEIPDTSDKNLFTKEEVKRLQLEAVQRYQKLSALVRSGGKWEGEIQREIRAGKRSFLSKYPGLCVRCEKRIEIGQRIFFFAGKGVWHMSCQDAIGIVGEDYDEDSKPDILPTTGRKFRKVV